MDKQELELSLEKTKINLMRKPNTVFYTTIIFSLVHKWTDEIPTAAVNGTHLFVNPEFWEQLTIPERMGVLCHEALHIALNHLTRRGNRKPIKWNKAGDYVINLSLKEGGYELPDWVLMDTQYNGMSTEQVYEKLPDEEEDSPMPGGADVIEPEDPASKQEVEEAVRDMIQKAAMQAKSESGSLPGNLPGEIAIFLEEITNPKLPWEMVLQNYMSQFCKEDYSWSRPNRRHLPDLYLPSCYSEALTDIATAVDASGSVSDEDFLHFINEHSIIQERLKPNKMTILTFDTGIRSIQEINPSTNIWQDLKFHGRGGTCVREVLAWARDQMPTVLIIFTDGGFHMPSEDEWPECPVLWIINDNPMFTAPFGETIHYEIQEV